MSTITRRRFIEQLALATGGLVLVPSVSAVGGRAAYAQNGQEALPELPPVPITKPADWDPIAFNRDRGNAGAIPESYHDEINGPDGVTQHLGKHLPYVPVVDPALVPAGFVAIMWGDPQLGYARHPNAPRDESNAYEGHWYNWMRIRKAVEDPTEELQSAYSNWPATEPDDTGAFAVFGGGDITEDSGKNTIYLAALPGDVQPGDTVRIWAHCLTHGEYVDFLTL